MNELKFSRDDIRRFSELGAKMIVGMAMRYALGEGRAIHLLYADVGSRFNLSDFVAQGGRCLEVGITEQNMIGVAAGMAHEGLNVFALTYAPFAIGRVFDQLKANLGEMQLPVKVIGSASGFAAADLGPLLACLDDIALARVIPGMLVVSPADGLETVKAIEAVSALNSPAYIRITGGKPLLPVYEEDYEFRVGSAVTLREGHDVLMIGCGAVLVNVIRAAKILKAAGYSCRVVNMHTIKPLDLDALADAAEYKLVVTVEEHSVIGGLGAAVAEAISEIPLGVPLLRLGTNDRYFVADTPESSIRTAGLDADSIAKRVLDRIEKCKVL